MLGAKHWIWETVLTVHHVREYTFTACANVGVGHLVNALIADKSVQ
jgi:hypothetical protein